ncbi:hypothetical protein [Novosphingobium sp. EMRT-2]|uniref:hypothetical protein n=1 Tax=Novosphingobium sp. EMRT-2 TaxID=2571749 RepID=UPI0010BD2970|nr:hypothetical protein [Novosphingobium sp. EMRT-2]QCI93186.1 hypothetical protein FA702_06215 [Novosphingobium sp. EMRT-2]
MFEIAAFNSATAARAGSDAALSAIDENAGSPAFQAVLDQRRASAARNANDDRAASTQRDTAKPADDLPASGKTLPVAGKTSGNDDDDASEKDEDRKDAEARATANIDPALIASFLRQTQANGNAAGASDATGGASAAATAPALPAAIAQTAKAAGAQIVNALGIPEDVAAAKLTLEPQGAAPAATTGDKAQAAAHAAAPQTADMLAQAMAPSETAHKAQSATLAAAVSTKVESDALPTDGYSLAAIQTAPATAAQPQGAAPANGASAAQPVNFATLVETIARAKEEAGMGTVGVSLAHAEFGKVSLQFRQEHNGLSVAMSSADPAFAPAVAAASRAEAGSTNADANAPRSEAQPRHAGGQAQTSADGANAQGRQGRAPIADTRPQTAAPRVGSQDTATDPNADGIYA